MVSKSVSNPKAIVIGLDGLEPTIVESMLDAGLLPNFKKLRDSGGYRRLRTTYPAQTPVAWSSFATGVNPGGHGIFDFICRDPQNYMPGMALSRFEKSKGFFGSPKLVNRRRGVPFWQMLARQGVRSTVLRCPCTYPPDSSPAAGADSGECTLLAGVGVPDLRGGQGTGSFYTRDRSVKAKEFEHVIQLDAGNELTTRLIGPRNTKTKPISDLVIELKVRIDASARTVRFEVAGSPAVEVAEGGWSPWVKVQFKMSGLQTICGQVRFHVPQIDPSFAFYVSPVNFDPDSPFFPISAPPTYAQELQQMIGPYATLGMAEDHTGLENERIDETAFLSQSYGVFEEREKMMLAELDRASEGFFFILFDTPDRMQHMLWRFRDKEHPRYEPEKAARFGPEIEEMYKACDRVVGKVLERVDNNTLLIVLSDHGMGTFRRSFDTNTWLVQQGLLTLKGSAKPGLDVDFGQVDWSKSSAYCMGLGGIYLNLRGREAAGIVAPGAEAERVSNAIISGLPQAVDSKTQLQAIDSVSPRSAIYSGPFADESPDLTVNFNPGFRVSWQSTVGHFAGALFEDNMRCWSGDHIFNPAAMPGILLMNRPVASGNPHIMDLAPTILKFLNVRPTTALEGTALI
jgi:predicted AlkP superfamily phosphohydrolase/phosphomutase